MDYTAGLVFGLWMNTSKQLGCKRGLFSPTDITAVMDDLVTNDDSLKTVQVKIFQLQYSSIIVVPRVS